MSEWQNTIVVRRLSAGDMDAACEVIGLAFADNPNALAVAGGDRDKARRTMSSAVRVAKLARRFSSVLVAEDGGQVIGVLNGSPWPNCQLRPIEMLKIAPSLIRAAGGAIIRQVKLASVWGKHDPRRPHWHIGPIGVHPGFQGRGVGKALLQSFLETADRAGLPAYLETDVDRNVALYEKFGFKVIGQIQIMGINNRFMWREVCP